MSIRMLVSRMLQSNRESTGSKLLRPWFLKPRTGGNEKVCICAVARKLLLHVEYTGCETHAEGTPQKLPQGTINGAATRHGRAQLVGSSPILALSGRQSLSAPRRRAAANRHTDHVFIAACGTRPCLHPVAPEFCRRGAARSHLRRGLGS